ncbi:MAG: gfo/Idh/MocA family oxidoreductase, partial [Beutenbergiaceae bacterium]
TSVVLHAAMTQNWQPDWRLRAWSQEAMVDIAFTPSYVHAGSATATLIQGGVKTTFGPYDRNGYVAQWQRLAQIVAGTAPPIPLDDSIADLTMALTIADQAQQVMNR